MKKNKNAYMHYVCPYCWNALNKCTCNLFPPYHLIFIDKNIQEHIRILNNKGYKTIGCCEGHKEVCTNTYIAFAKNYFKDLNMPNGFYYNEKRLMIICDYPSKLTEEQLEEVKKESLATLLEWCNNLPTKSTEK